MQLEINDCSGRRFFLAGMVHNEPNSGRQLSLYDHAEMKRKIENHKRIGATAMRWNTFLFGRDLRWDANGYCTGMCANAVANIKDCLDLAYTNGIVIQIVLSTAHFLSYGTQTPEEVTRVNNLRFMFTNAVATQYYITNVIRAITQTIGVHPGLFGYCLINEASGMYYPEDAGTGTWSDVKVHMADFQKWVNRVAAEIHNNQPGAICSVSGIASGLYQYADAALIAAGGKTNGIMDIHQVQYYPDNHKDAWSPFLHTPQEFINLYGGGVKPIVNGETPIENNAFPLGECYTRLYTNGFSGGFTWSQRVYELYMTPEEQAVVDAAYRNLYNTYLWTNDFNGTQCTTPPCITGQPQKVTVLPGQPAAFSVTATGAFPLSYQWRFDGVALAGATTPVLTIPAVGTTNTGAYSVLVTNAFGEALSTNAPLVLMPVTGWGDNSFGQDHVLEFATNAIAIAAGGWHTLALRADGGVAAWGDDSRGQCAVPPTLQDAVAIAAGGYHGLAIRANGSVIAWGADDYGQTNVPVGLGHVIGIAAGTWHSVALRADGTVRVWGDNSFGQANQPAGLTNVTALAAGGNHTLALKADGTVVAWGENTDAEGYVAGQSVVPWGLTNVVAIGAGQYHSLAVKRDGTVVAWGDNSQGQCSVPPGLTHVVAVSGGGAHSLALGTDGALTAWGADWNNQCDIPPGLFPAVGIAAGCYHTAVLLESIVPVPQLLNPARNGNQFSALVQTLSRKCYALEANSSLASTNWTCLSTNAGNGALRILTDPTATGLRRFYRMRQW